MNPDGQEHEAVRLSLGAYLLGGLSPAERAHVERHTASCPSCRDELAGLAMVPTLLHRIEPPAQPAAPDFSADSGLDGDGAPGSSDGSPGSSDDTVLSRLLEGVRNDRARRRKQLMGWRVMAAVAAVTAAAALAGTVGSAVGDRPRASGAPPDITMTPSGGGTSASGRTGLEGRPWGTAVSLELERLPAEESFVAWAIADDGRREPTATWGSTADGRARLSGATAIPRAELARLEVTTTAGAPVLTAPA